MSQGVVLEFAIPITRISVAPTADRSSMTVATRFFSTMALTATQPSSSRAVMVGARFPGVMAQALDKMLRGMLYWQSTYFLAAIGSVSIACWV